MSIYIYNSLSRKKEEFTPLKPPAVTMYVCGPTVYDEPHIGHARSAFVFDVIRRYLAYRGYLVTFVRNVTDVDDKIIAKARKEFPNDDLNVSFVRVSGKYLDAYHEAMDSLGIQRPDVEPMASEYIGKMVSFIEKLIERGVAYQSGNDVYFDITKAKDYGKLSHQSFDNMEAGSRVAVLENKRNPLDFALWKAAKEQEPSWDSPWGKGRPGWHIECSVMSSALLGDQFDIHGGGLDLIFPHHENEIAQSEGAGKPFARYWLHHGLLTISAQKMAKSLGNFVTVKDFLARHKDADILRMLFLSAHYTHPIDYTEEKVCEMRQALERIIILKEKIEKVQGVLPQDITQDIPELTAAKQRFIAVMDDDFNTPQALAVIFDLVNCINKRIEDVAFTVGAYELLRGCLGTLGITLSKQQAVVGISEDEIEAKIKERQRARAAKDFVRSDTLRKELEAQGIIIEDSKSGTTWRRKL
ncbi:MAG: cysteine--tRNA ligase [Candidatus Omnitrophica bacterium]|nr:cysteine--tRNA ligase [Candidatus Omnitrophota bacterium]